MTRHVAPGDTVAILREDFPVATDEDRAERRIASIEGLASATTAERVRILYGGSVKPDNIDALMAEPNIDGALVGGASLDAAGFTRIVQFQE